VIIAPIPGEVTGLLGGFVFGQLSLLRRSTSFGPIIRAVVEL